MNIRLLRSVTRMKLEIMCLSLRNLGLGKKSEGTGSLIVVGEWTVAGDQ